MTENKDKEVLDNDIENDWDEHDERPRNFLEDEDDPYKDNVERPQRHLIREMNELD